MRNLVKTGMGALSALLLLVGGTTACSNILDADLPGRIPTDLLNDPTTATTLAASVVADFECGFSNYVDGTTLLGDQFLGASGNLAAKNWGTRKVTDTDANNEQDTCLLFFGSYLPLHTARFQSNTIGERLQGWTDAEAGVSLAPLRARVATYGAYSLTLLGEGFCRMRIDQATTLLDPPQVLAMAEARFDEASALVDAITATGDLAAKAELRSLVQVGRARVRLDRGNKAGAASDAALVPAGFQLVATRGSDAVSRYNKAFYIITELANGSVAPEYRNLTIGAKPDPRVVVAFGPTVGLDDAAFDGVTPFYVVTNKNFSRGDPMRLASAVEAQLIRAEALGGSDAVTIVNARRTELGLDPYTGATDAASITALILSERNREFFMEGGQRYNDLLRYQLPWKTGNDQNGIAYGTTTCMPLPANERIAAGG